MDDAKAETAPAEEKQLTPAQLAEIEENKRPFLDKFGALIYEANERLRHGTTLTQTFVDALTALYDEAEKGGAPGSKLRQAAMQQQALADGQLLGGAAGERQLTAAELQVRADREARRAQRAKDQQAFDDAKKAELAAADALAKDDADV